MAQFPASPFGKPRRRVESISAVRRRRFGRHADLTGEVRIMDPQTGGQMSLKGHALNVTDCAFSPDGRRLATTRIDKSIRIWDLATGQEVLKLAGFATWVKRIRFDAQGHRLLGAAAPTARFTPGTPLRPPMNRCDLARTSDEIESSAGI